MNQLALEIAASLIAFAAKLVEAFQLDNAELKAKVEEALDSESKAAKALDDYNKLVGK